jgi:dTDP-4-dehydrorhamnose 3,5-epimerase
MQVEPLSLAGSFTLTPRRFGDERGFFSETFRAEALEAAGVNAVFVQDNHARTAQKGTLRGLHFQVPPHAQAKLIRCVRGAILDVIVDLRRSSATYGRSQAVELSDANWKQLFVPVGFAHGYLTLRDDCEVLYKTTAYYEPEAEGGLLWSDRDLAIDWRLGSCEIRTNSRDAEWPPLSVLQSPF